MTLGKEPTENGGASAAWKHVEKLIGMAKGPKRREWGTIGELEILVSSDGGVVLCKGYREHGPSLEHPWLELTHEELRALLARGKELLRASRRSSRRPASMEALHIRRPRFFLRTGDEEFPFLRNVEKKEATAPLAAYLEEACKGPIVVTVRGRPVAFLAMVKGSDLEDLSIGTDPGFLEVLRRSRERYKSRGGISTKEMRRRRVDRARPEGKKTAPRRGRPRARGGGVR